jgi:hypothetical protein
LNAVKERKIHVPTVAVFTANLCKSWRSGLYAADQIAELGALICRAHHVSELPEQQRDMLLQLDMSFTRDGAHLVLRAGRSVVAEGRAALSPRTKTAARTARVIRKNATQTA